MVSYSELKKGAQILMKKEPWEIIESHPRARGRGRGLIEAKIKNLISGQVLDWVFRPADNFPEPEIEKKELKYLYSSAEKVIFCVQENPGQRFELSEPQIENAVNFLKENQKVTGLFFEGRLINIFLPIKILLTVVEAPPAIGGQSAEPGTKSVKLETGLKMNVPLFIQEGDVVEINTQTGEYVRRISKK